MQTRGNTPMAETGRTPNDMILSAVISALCSMDKLPLESRLDLVGAALDYYMVAMMADFLEMMTTGQGGRPFDLVRRADDKAKEAVWLSARSALRETQSRVPPLCDRFFNLCEMVKEKT